MKLRIEWTLMGIDSAQTNKMRIRYLVWDLMSSISFELWRPLTIPFGLRSRFFGLPEKWLKWNDLTVREIGSRCAFATLIGDFKSISSPLCCYWFAGWQLDTALFQPKNVSLSPPLRSNNNCRWSVNSDRGKGGERGSQLMLVPCTIRRRPH